MESAELPAITEEDWAQVDVPEGWDPIADACRRMGAGLPGFCERVAREVTEVIPEPSTATSGVGEGSQRRQWMAYLLVRPAILGMAQNRAPLGSETEVASNIGSAFAHLGGSPDDILRAFQIAFRAFLSELSSFVDPHESEKLVASVSTLWIWLQEMSDAAARGYRDEAGKLAALSVDARERFFSTIQRGDVSSESVHQLAQSLGFDVRGSFLALWLKAVVDESRLHGSMHTLPGTTQALVRGTEVIIIGQGVPSDQLEAAMNALVPGAPVGVGMERQHLDGARMSLLDARWAVELSEVSGRPIRFEEDWLLATLHAQRDQLAFLMEPGVQVAREQDHLAEAVYAFGANAFSQSAAARKLHLRPNSLGYRLQRWSDLVGRSAMTLDGLVYALLAKLCSTENEA
jgi:hypothetical protein